MIVVSDMVRLILLAGKKEVRRQGVPSHARRPMERDEFQQILTACHECEDEDDPSLLMRGDG